MQNTQENQTIVPSYTSMFNSFMIGSLAETNYDVVLACGLLTKNPSGVTKVYSDMLNDHTKAIISVSAKVWYNIETIKKLVDLRSSIDESKIQNADDSKDLLDQTKRLQDIINTISDQEIDFLDIYSKVNTEVYNIYNNYSQSLSESSQSFYQLLPKTLADNQLDLPDDLYTPTDIQEAKSIDVLSTIAIQNNLQSFCQNEPIAFALNKLDHTKADDFVAIQVWVNILSRHAQKSSATLLSQNARKAFAEEELLSYLVEHKSDFPITINHSSASIETDIANTEKKLDTNLIMNPKIIHQLEQDLQQTSQNLSHLPATEEPKSSSDSSN